MLLKKFLRGLAFVDEEQRNYNNPLAIKAPNINRNRMTSPQFFSISFRMWPGWGGLPVCNQISVYFSRGRVSYAVRNVSNESIPIRRGGKFVKLLHS